MSATISTTVGWPTLEEVERIVGLFRDAYNELDRLTLRMSNLVDSTDPWEPIRGVPTPTLADVGVLSRLLVELDGHKLGMRPFVKRIRQGRDSASAFEAQARGGRT